MIESALKPDLRVTPAGVQEPFKEGVAAPCAPATWIRILRSFATLRLRSSTPHFKQQVQSKGKAEHDDPTKAHALSELERIGNTSKRETDAVFGQYKKGPALKADTKARRGNIHDLFKDTEDRLKGMSACAKREMARQLVFYFFQSDREILCINAVHNADPKFTAGDAPVNNEAKDQATGTFRSVHRDQIEIYSKSIPLRIPVREQAALKHLIR